MKNFLQQAIYRQITIGGKLFCWHDWIYLSIYFPKSAWEYVKGFDAEYLCVKCGKSKISYMGAELTRYDENNNLIK